MNKISGEIWHKRRKLLTPAFHFSILNEYISVMVKNFKIFTDVLEKEVDSKGFDISSYITIYSMNTIGGKKMPTFTQLGSFFNQIYSKHSCYVEYCKKVGISLG